MAVVITVPISLPLTVAVLAVYGRAEALGDARTPRAEVGLSLRVQELLHQLQPERRLANGLLGGEESFSSPLAATCKRVDTTLRGMRSELAVEEVIQRHVRRLATIRATADRGTVGSNPADRTVTLAFYPTVIEALNRADAGAWWDVMTVFVDDLYAVQQ